MLSEAIPSLLQDATNLNRDLGEILISQAMIQGKLADRPDYLSLVRKVRGEPLVIAVKTVETTEAKVTVLDPAAVAGFRQGLMRSIEKYEDPVAELRSRLEGQNLGRSRGLVTALINALPGERRKDVFRMRPEEQIGVLLKELPEELVAKGFKPAAFGWNQATLSKMEALSRLHQLRATDAETTSLVELALLLHPQMQMAANKVDKENLRKGILQLGEEDLLRLTLKSETDLLSGKARELLNLQGQGSKSFNNLVDEVSAHLKKVAEQKTVKNVVSESRLVLKEIPPVVGIMRGFLGSDCATSHSFAFANAPSERVFAVYAADGTVKGYAAMSIVKDDASRPQIYLHTIAGKRMSAIDARMIIHAIDQAKGKLGGESVLLPNAKRLEENINSIELRSAFESAAVATESRPISFFDEDIRHEIKTLANHDAQYDDPANNSEGFALKRDFATQANLPEMTVETAIHRERIDFQRTPTRAQLVGMALDMISQKLSEKPVFKALMSLLEMPNPAIARLKSTVSNLSRLEVKAYLSAVQNEVRTLGYELNESEIQARWANFFLGLLSSPDFASHSNEKFVKGLIKNAIQAKRVSYLEELNRQYPGYLAKDPDLVSRMLAKAETASLAASFFARAPELFETLPLDEKARGLLLDKLEENNPGLKAALQRLQASGSAGELLTALESGRPGDQAWKLAAGMQARRFLGLSPSSDQLVRFAGRVNNPSMEWTRSALARADSIGQALKLIEGGDSVFGMLSHSGKERLVSFASDLRRFSTGRTVQPETTTTTTITTTTHAGLRQIAKWVDTLEPQRRIEFFDDLRGARHEGDDVASTVFGLLSERTRASMPLDLVRNSMPRDCRALFHK